MTTATKRKRRAKARATQSELSQILGVNPSTVSNAKHSITFPKRVDGTFEILAVLIWWMKHKPHAFQQAQPASPTITEREILDLQLKEAELRLKRGELVRISDVEPMLSRLAAELNGAIRTVEDAVGLPVAEYVEPVFETFFERMRAIESPDNQNTETE